MLNNTPQCPGCGHIFYEGGSGLCKWCIQEQKEHEKSIDDLLDELCEDNGEYPF